MNNYLFKNILEFTEKHSPSKSLSWKKDFSKASLKDQVNWRFRLNTIVYSISWCFIQSKCTYSEVEPS